MIKSSKGASHSNLATIVPPSAPSVNMPQKLVIAEPVQHRPTSPGIPGHNSYSTPSILYALRDDPKTEDIGVKSEIPANQYSKNATNQPFTQQELLDTWKNFVATIGAAQLKSALDTREPILTADWQIEYELDTELQLNRLTLDLKPKLLGYLRHQLRNDAIEIHFKVSDDTDTQSHVPYTETERWALLVEKYPALATLKSKFGLDFERS